MANPIKGEVPFVVGDRTYTFKLGHNARAEVAGMLGKPFGDVVGNLVDDSFRVVVWAGLHQHHPELSLFDVGDMMDAVGDEYVGDVFKQALELAAPKGTGSRPQ